MIGQKESDAMLRRFERNYAIAALVMAGACAVAGRIDVALGVVAGALLMAFSYWAIKGGVEAVMPSPVAGGSRRRRGALAARFVGRYALLALAAYVMLACLHTHPVGMLLGVTSAVVAVAAEAVRFLRSPAPPGQPR